MNDDSVISIHDWNWENAYDNWHRLIFRSDTSKAITPNGKQEEVLAMVHARCVAEQTTSDTSPPLLRLVHSLPGSGKSQLLKWIRSYFIEVWQWTLGREFVFLAPFNSMACGIGGATVHSWGHISFKDKRGVIILPTDGQSTDELPSMTIRCGALRWIFIDEVEALGAETFGELEQTISYHIPSKSPFKRTATGTVRPYGGVNVILSGDFWQQRPPGQISLMSNPFALKVKESARAALSMGMFWFGDLNFSLQTWKGQERMLHLDTNERSGADKWYSDVLQSSPRTR